MLARVIRFLAAPWLAAGVIGGMVLYATAAVGIPAADLGKPLGDRPFVAIPFLGLVVLLFLNTLSCTWLRGVKIFGLWRGLIPGGALEFTAETRSEINEFLQKAGYRGTGVLLWRNRFAVGSGWFLHLGLLLLMIGVGAQLAFHDGAAFELAVGETVLISDPGAVFGRSKGPLAPNDPPQLRISLVSYDPHLHQEGFAPDRKSRLRLETDRGESKEVLLDRVQGATIAGTTVYQVMPAGVALVIDIPGIGMRAIHLQQVSDRRAEADITDPAGQPVRVIIESEFGLADRRGSGALRAQMIGPRHKEILEVGDSFLFGGVETRLRDVVRWSGFTYARSPGMPAVFAGFAVVLIACTLLLLPAGVACLEVSSEGAKARVWLNRGGAVLRADWDRWVETRVDDGGVV